MNRANESAHSPLRVAILGYGWVARDYMLSAMLASTYVRPVAISALKETEMEDCPNSIRRFTNWRRMIEEMDLDAVYIATPNFVHREQAEFCLKRGVHVLCEKPMATTLSDAEAMIGAAERSGKVYATAYDQRFHPAHRAMYELVQAGKLGTLTQIRLDYACWLPKTWCADNWRIDRTRAGGGAIIDLAPHGLDLIELISGKQIEQLEVFAQTAVQDYAVDDGGILVARLQDEVLASLHVGYNRPDAFPRRRLEFIGTEGMLVATNTMGQTPGGTVTHYDTRTGTATAIEFSTQTSPFLQQIDSFARSIRNEQVPLRSPSDDLRLTGLLYHELKRLEATDPVHSTSI